MSALLYAAGIGALLVCDLLVTNHFDSTEIADWALFRSLVGILAVLPLTGLDQVLVRSPLSSGRLLKQLILQIPLFGLLVGLALDITGIMEHWVLGAGLAISSASSLMLFQYFRSHRHLVLAPLAQQGWKIGALILLAYLVATDKNVDLILCGVILLFVADAVSGIFLVRFSPAKLKTQAHNRLDRFTLSDYVSW